MNHQQRAPYPLRMSDEMRNQLQEQANTAGRSLNAEILHRLQKSLEADHEVVEARTTSTSGADSVQPTYDELKEALIAIAKTNTLEKLDKKINALDKTLEDMSIKLSRISKG